MEWEQLQPSQLQELVDYEVGIFDEPDRSTVQEYLNHIKTNNLHIHVLRDSSGIIGCYQILPEEDRVFMCGFSIHPNHRGGDLSRILMNHLIHNYLDQGIVCKTLANHPAMRKILNSSGWKNDLDKFEKGILWSWWYINNDTIAKKAGLKP